MDASSFFIATPRDLHEPRLQAAKAAGVPNRCMGGVFRDDCPSDEDFRDSPSGGAREARAIAEKAKPNRPTDDPSRQENPSDPPSNKRRAGHGGIVLTGRFIQVRRVDAQRRDCSVIHFRLRRNATQASPLQ